MNSAESLVGDAGEPGQVSRMLVDYVFDRAELRQRAVIRDYAWRFFRDDASAVR